MWCGVCVRASVYDSQLMWCYSRWGWRRGADSGTRRARAEEKNRGRALENAVSLKQYQYDFMAIRFSKVFDWISNKLPPLWLLLLLHDGGGGGGGSGGCCSRFQFVRVVVAVVFSLLFHHFSIEIYDLQSQIDACVVNEFLHIQTCECVYVSQRASEWVSAIHNKCSSECSPDS